MKISELKAGQGSVNIEATVVSIEEPKIINKYGKDLKLANAIITDGSGEIKLTLWNTDVDKVKTGSVVKITNGYVTEFKGEKQITSGKFGKLEVVGEGEAPAKSSAQKPKKSEDDEEDSRDNEEFDEENIEEEVVDY